MKIGIAFEITDEFIKHVQYIWYRDWFGKFTVLGLTYVCLVVPTVVLIAGIGSISRPAIINKEFRCAKCNETMEMIEHVPDRKTRR